MQRHTILFVAANPTGTALLTSSAEYMAIDGALTESQRRDQISLEAALAASADTVLAALERYDPTVLHFSGHGTEQETLQFQHPDSSPQDVSIDELNLLFGRRWKRLQLVVLNACHSVFQAEAIARHMPCAIGMRRAIRNREAVPFARGLYRSLGYRQPVAAAVGSAHLSMRWAPDARRPVDDPIELRHRQGIDPNNFFVFEDGPPPGQTGMWPSDLSRAAKLARLNQVRRLSGLAISPHFIDPVIVPACSDLYGDATSAGMRISEANSLRAQVAPPPVAESFLRPGELLNPDKNPPDDFWYRAFGTANLKGPRLYGALLLSIYSQSMEPEVRAAIEQSIAKL